MEPGGPSGALSPFIHASYARPSKLGIVGSSRRQAADRPQSSPVPRGPKSHLWQPAANRSQPSSAGDVSSTPKPCTPSTHSSTRSRSGRCRFAARTTAAMSRIGSFTPVEEWTHVTATHRVRGVSARSIEEPMRSRDAVAGSS